MSKSKKKKPTNYKLKSDLIILSLSPLFIFTFIKNFEFDCKSLVLCNFVTNNLCILIVLFTCIVWVTLSVIAFINFKIFRGRDWKEGFEITECCQQKQASLEFLLAYILPISIDDLDKWQNATVFALILLLMVLLLSKTNLYYGNVFLSIIGYQVIEFEFKEPPDNEDKKRLIGICPRKIDTNRVIKYKFIDDNVYCIKQKHIKQKGTQE